MKKLDLSTKFLIFVAVLAFYYPICLDVLKNPGDPVYILAIVVSVIAGIIFTTLVAHWSKEQ